MRAVRINACDSKWCYEDIISVVEGAGDHIDCLVIPKVENVDHVQFVDTLLTQIELRAGLGRRIGLQLQIESARGMENIDAIAGASSRSEALVFGPADSLASLRVPELTVGRLKPEYPGDYCTTSCAGWWWRRERTICRAIDGPYAQIRDLDGLRTLAGRAAMLGFDGKWAVHPQQVEVLNEVFTPLQEDFDRASAIIEAYRKATDDDLSGAVVLGDEMIDEASRKMALVMVERGQAFGMRARPWKPATTR